MNDDIDIRHRYDGPLASTKIEVEFNWRPLGEYFMRADSEQQADFLRGWLAEAQHLGYVPTDHQYMYAADAIAGDVTRQALADQLRRLAIFLEGADR